MYSSKNYEINNGFVNAGHIAWFGRSPKALQSWHLFGPLVTMHFEVSSLEISIKLCKL